MARISATISGKEIKNVIEKLQLEGRYSKKIIETLNELGISIITPFGVKTFQDIMDELKVKMDNLEE